MPENGESDVCGAQKRAGSGACQRPAGWGTDHVGEGRCKLHGGNAGRPPEHGRYSAKKRKSLQKKIRKFREEENPAQMWEELAVLRALLQDWISELETVDGDSVSVVVDLVNALRKCLNTINQIRTRTALTAAEVEFLQARMADVLQKHLPREEQATAVRELKQITEADEKR